MLAAVMPVVIGMVTFRTVVVSIGATPLGVVQIEATPIGVVPIVSEVPVMVPAANLEAELLADRPSLVAIAALIGARRDRREDSQTHYGCESAHRCSFHLRNLLSSRSITVPVIT